MNSNYGITATGGSHVVGNAVASGSNAKADVRDSGPAQFGEDRRLTPREIGDLLAQLIDELRRSEHPGSADLIEAAQEAREELGSEEPRLGMLRMFSRALVDAVPGVTALTSLAATIQEAIQRL
ncbi:hypothetical protein AQJ11_32125 [Streptomyces corchorusii]|uniref:Uncharacterized protein n=2 Tax=Streptomyces TaxID=1883 RepID=A0A117QBN6_STRCK|nr:hypothetical protein [Streptomyces corchorusii]KUN19424.1 hypothetical protein AQJ11_32125 [Streptomyces corchorusii]